MQRAEQILPWVQGPRVLDIGCAAHAMKFDDPHWLHGMLCRQFPDTAGIDIRPDLIDQLRQRGFRNLYVENAETFELGRQYDTIVAGDVIEHLSNPGAFLRQTAKHLAPGGKLILTTPYPFCMVQFAYAALKYPRTTWNLEHTHWLCPQTLSEACRRVGLQFLHSQLILDYPMNDPSFMYRAFVIWLKIFGWLIPARLRCSAILVVATQAEKSDLRPYRTDILEKELQPT